MKKPLSLIKELFESFFKLRDTEKSLSAMTDDNKWISMPSGSEF